jgi:uncharacterized protein (TIGR00299 family) protein
MILGALISLGADSSAISTQLAELGVDGLAISTEGVQRCKLSCTRVLVSVPTDGTSHRSWSSIDTLIASSALTPAVVSGARATFRRLAEVEANIHDSAIDEVHFHEVGAHDAIADIVGTWIGWDLLGAPRVSIGNFGLGHGRVQAAHGELPLPAPAVVELLAGWPVRPLDVDMETVTPTGAALLTMMAADHDAGPPAGTIVRAGRGAGGRDPEGHPNVVTAIALATAAQADLETMAELTTNVDDVTAEVLAFTIERCLEDGAADAWITPIIMKKGRPGQQLTVLCRPAQIEDLRSRVLQETGSLGIRHTTVERYAVARRSHTVEVDGHRVRIKVGPDGAKPEFDDCAAAARVLGRPVREVQTGALKVFSSINREADPTESV